MAIVAAEMSEVGLLLRGWRRRRRLSQLDLALEGGVSTRHLSFVETGRARPSPEMVVHLAEQLEVPLRDRNRLLLAAGYAPTYRERALDEPDMGPVREALDRVLVAHEPYPAVVVDRGWNLVASNASVGLLLAGVAPHLLEPPANVLRISLHPEGVAPRIVNLGEWRAHLLERLQRQVALTGDPELAALHDELSAYPGPAPPPARPPPTRAATRSPSPCASAPTPASSRSSARSPRSGQPSTSRSPSCRSSRSSPPTPRPRRRSDEPASCRPAAPPRPALPRVGTPRRHTTVRLGLASRRLEARPDPAAADEEPRRRRARDPHRAARDARRAHRPPAAQRRH